MTRIVTRKTKAPVSPEESILRAIGDDSLPLDEEDFWTARPELGKIRQMARARRASPWATFGNAGARVLATVRPCVVLPPLRGREASLNMFVAICGVSGRGKDASSGAAEAVLPVEVTTIGCGSGEGIAQQYMHRVEGQVMMYDSSVIFEMSEVKTLGALKDRSASTLLPELNKAWMGQRLGFGYVDKAKRLPMPLHTYRLGLIVLTQDDNAGIILSDSASGTPQRYLWFPATDAGAPKVKPDEPKPITLDIGPEYATEDYPGQDVELGTAGRTGELHVMKVCKSIEQDVDAEALMSLDPEWDGDTLLAHTLLAREKVAAVLALLDGRADEITEEDWALSAYVMDVSDRTRNAIVAKAHAAQVAANAHRGKQEAQRAIIVTDEVVKSALDRVKETIVVRLGTRWTSRSRVRMSIAYRDREYIIEALGQLVSEGKIEHKDGEYQNQPGDYYRAAG